MLLNIFWVILKGFGKLALQVMSFKNYYETLGVSPQASLDLIKKKFRELAKVYHPDTNANDEFAARHFTALQEAYETLSQPARRTKYDFEWKLHFPYANNKHTREQTAFSLLDDSIRLNKKIAAMDRYRMNKDAVFLWINDILSEANLNILLKDVDRVVNQQLISQLISASSVLPFRYIIPIATSLRRIAGDSTTDLQLIEDFVEKNRWEHYWQIFYPIIVLLITGALCGAIYLLTE